MQKKIIVAHPQQQHSYKTAAAIKKNNSLFMYITTVYSKQTSILMLVVKKILNSENLKRANSRKSAELNDFEVKQFLEFSGFISLFLYRVNKKAYAKYSEYISKTFGKKVAYYAINNKVDAVIMYDTKATYCFNKLKEKEPKIKRILDMSAPSLVFMENKIREDINKYGDWDNLIEEFNSKIYKEKIKKAKKEIELADYFIVASNFAKQSLKFHGIDDEKICVIPYGIDAKIYECSRNIKIKNDKLNIIFLGRVTQKKGFHHFINVVDDLTSINCTIMGDYNESNLLVQKAKKKYHFTGRILKDDVINILLDSDILLFPSLSDGFGLSALEALAAGVVVICSVNSGVSDLIIDGYNGYVVKSDEKEKTKKIIENLQKNPDELNKMKKNARETAKKYSWDKYNESFKTLINKIEGDKNER